MLLLNLHDSATTAGRGGEPDTHSSSVVFLVVNQVISSRNCTLQQSSVKAANAKDETLISARSYFKLPLQLIVELTNTGSCRAQPFT